MIAALFVSERGPYMGLPDVEAWGVSRDARTYPGPWPVVAHPPCERWGRFWFGGPQWLKDGKPRKSLGDDGGCFVAALTAVRTFGGVLEHPADSHAWTAFGLRPPPRAGGWVGSLDGGWTCCVDQGHYGHRGQKATWLYAMHVRDLPSLRWGKAPSRVPRSAGRREIRNGVVQMLSRKQRAETPPEFRDLLIAMARVCEVG